MRGVCQDAGYGGFCILTKVRIHLRHKMWDCRGAMLKTSPQPV
jgi:hypothetical protein